MNFLYDCEISPAPISFAAPSFGHDGVPQSPLFGDVYFSDAGGALEKQHVFVQGNNLPQRLLETKEQSFAIGETGFGSGLTLLVLMHNLVNTNFTAKNTELIYITTELYPMKHQDMQLAHAIFPELAAESIALLSCYDEKLLKPGLNLLTPWPHTKVYLLIGDVLNTLPRLTIKDGNISAWFLDGFSPQKDIAMWSLECAHELRRLAHVGATISSYTVAGFVRRNLTTAGFKVTRSPGFGRKREMLTGIAV